MKHIFTIILPLDHTFDGDAGGLHEAGEGGAEGRGEVAGRQLPSSRSVVTKEVLWRPEGSVHGYEAHTGESGIQQDSSDARKVENGGDGEDGRSYQLLHLAKGPPPDRHGPRVHSHDVKPKAAEHQEPNDGARLGNEEGRDREEHQNQVVHSEVSDVLSHPSHRIGDPVRLVWWCRDVSGRKQREARACGKTNEKERVSILAGLNVRRERERGAKRVAREVPPGCPVERPSFAKTHLREGGTIDELLPRLGGLDQVCRDVLGLREGSLGTFDHKRHGWGRHLVVCPSTSNAKRRSGSAWFYCRGSPKALKRQMQGSKARPFCPTTACE
mmetsp:Transcript_6765/g.16501  ORF Transcript_6765/g.16501 Transcript_6765/m.16501 type:complete len:328 (-) Transcript_6765:42-1025(-)